MKKPYFKPLTDIIPTEMTLHILENSGRFNGKYSMSNENEVSDFESDLSNPQGSLWDED